MTSAPMVFPKIWIERDHFKDGKLTGRWKSDSVSLWVRDFNSFEDVPYPEGYYVMMPTEMHEEILDKVKQEHEALTAELQRKLERSEKANDMQALTINEYQDAICSFFGYFQNNSKKISPNDAKILLRQYKELVDKK